MKQGIEDVVYCIDFAWIAEHAKMDGLNLGSEDVERVANRFEDLVFGEYNQAVGDLMHQIREQAMRDCGFEKE